MAIGPTFVRMGDNESCRAFTIMIGCFVQGIKTGYCKAWEQDIATKTKMKLNAVSVTVVKCSVAVILVETISCQLISGIH
jgi:hypothetical protein